MSREIVEVKSLSKSFRVFPSMLSRLLSWFKIGKGNYKEVCILKDIDFKVKKGEALGIMGVNGAGKSTLLKIITGTMQPSSGSVFLSGKVAALLELGIGFNPEMTGRQNAILTAGMFGISNSELPTVIDDIQSFSEIDHYFDKPVKTYSSGMQMRLAFSIATAKRPDLLIVDEALSVGDSYFQHKCMLRIRDYRHEGTSILFVSHDIGAVKTVCDNALLLDKGRIRKKGRADEIADYYNALIAAKEKANLSIDQRRDESGFLVSKSGTEEAVVSHISLLDSISREHIAVVKTGQLVTFELLVNSNNSIENLVLGLMIRDVNGVAVWGTNTWYSRQVCESVKAGEQLVYYLDLKCSLGQGSYALSTALCSSQNHLENNYQWVENNYIFDVVNIDKDLFIGLVDLDHTISLERH